MYSIQGLITELKDRKNNIYFAFTLGKNVINVMGTICFA